MSVDNRVVKLQFDNAQFEQGVSQSMKTIDELEDKLQFKKSAKGFQSLQEAADAIGFDKLVLGIETINKKLSATGVLAANMVKKIGDSIAASIKQLEQATIGQMKAGGWARAMKIENAKFAVQGLKGDWEQLYKAIDYSVTGTAYGVDAAAKAASTFMASGVDYVKVIDTKNGEQLTQMHKALRAISGVAAQTNSEFEDIAHIFTTVAGNGKLMGDQLQQLSGRGMNAAAILGEQLHMSEAAVREATSKGQIDFVTFANAMDNAFGDHAKDANKTFTGSLSNMKAALSRFGAVFATPVIQKTNTFFIAVTGQLKKMKNAISDTKNAAGELEEHLEGHFAKMWENLINLGSALVDNLDISWFNRLADSADEAVVKLSGLFEVMGKYAKELGGDNGSVAKTLWNLATITQEEKEVAEMVIRGSFDSGAKRKRLLEDYIKKNELNMNPDKIQAYVNVVAKFGYSFDKAKIKVGEFTEEEEAAAQEQKTILDVFKNIKSILDSIARIFGNIIYVIKSYRSALLGSIGGITGLLYGVSEVIKTLANSIGTLTLMLIPSEKTLTGFAYVAMVVGEFLTDVKEGLIDVINGLTDYIKSLIYTWEQNGVLERTFINIARVLKNLHKILKNLATTATRLFKAIGKAFFKVFKPDKATGLVADFTDHLAAFSDNLLLSEEAADQLSEIFEKLFTIIDGVFTKVSALADKFFSIFTGIRHGEDQIEEVADETYDVGEEVKETTKKFDKFIEIGDKIKNFFKGIVDGFKQLGEELKKNDGIIHLKESFEKLGDAFKGGVTEKFAEFKDGIETINEEAGTHFTISDLAEGIGKFADKVADVVDKIPAVVDKVEKFFSKVWDVIKGFFKSIAEDETWQGLKDFFDSLFGFGEGIIEGAGDKLHDLGESIMDGLNGIEWNDVLGGSFVLGALGFLVKMGNVCDAITGLFDSVGGIVEAVTNIGDSVVGMITTFGSSMKKVTDSIVIGTIAASIIGIAAALFIISKIPEDDLSKATGTMEVIVMLFAGVVALILKMMANNNAAAAARVAQMNATVFGKEIEAAAVKWVKLVGIIWAFSVAIKAVTSAIRDIAVMVKEFDETVQVDAIMGVLIIFVVLAAAIAGITFAASKLIKKFYVGLVDAKKLALVMGSFGGVMILMAASVWLVVQSIKELAETGMSSDNLLTSAGAVFLIIIALAAGVSGLMLTVKGIRLGDLGAVAIILLELIVALGIVFAGIYLLASLLTIDNVVNGGFKSAMETAMLLVCGVLLAIAASVVLITKALSEMGKRMMSSHTTSKMISKVMLGLVALIAVTLICMTILAGIIKGMDSTQTTALIASMVMVVVALIGISWIMESISKVLANFGSGGADLDKGTKFILALGGMMLMMFAGIALIIVAVSGMETSVEQLLVAAVIVTVAMGGLIAIMLVMAKVAKDSSFDATKLEAVSKSLLIASAAFLVLGIAMGVLCYVAKDLTPDQLLGVIGLISLSVLALVAISEICKKHSGAPKYAKTLKALALAMVGFGAMILLLAAASWALQDVSWEALGKVGAIVGVLVLIFAVLSAAAGSNFLNMGTGMEKVADVLQKIAIACIIFAASIVVLAAGLWLLGPGASSAGEGLEVLFTVIEEHKGVAIALGGAILVVIIAITIAILKLAPTLTSLVNAVTTAFNAIFGAIKTVGKAIWNFIKTGGTKIGKALKDFFTNSNISAGLKAGVTAIVVAIASGLTDSGPQILQKIGDFILMLIDWLIKAIPKIAEKLVEILLELIWGILDALTAHINEIEAAIEAIVETILAILGKLLFDAIAALVDGLAAMLPTKVADWLGLTESAENMRMLGDTFVEAARMHSKELKEAARERDEAIRDGAVDTAKLYDNLFGTTKAKKPDDSGVLSAAKQMKDDSKEANEKAKEAAFERKQAFLAFSDSVDMDKNFLYAMRDDNVRLEEMKGLIDSRKGFADESGNFYRIKVGDLKLLDGDPNTIDKYDYYYIKQTKENAEETGEAVAEAQEEGLLSGLKNGLTEKVKSFIPGTDSSGDVLGNAMSKLGVSTDLANQNGWNVGDALGGGIGDGALDSLGIEMPQIADMTGEGGELAGYNFTTEFGSAINDSVEDKDYEKAGESISKATTEGINNKESKEAMEKAADEFGDNMSKELIWQKRKAYRASEFIVEGLRKPLEQFMNGSPMDPNSITHLAVGITDKFINTITGKEGFDEHSPSKKMLEIGQYLVQGLTNGIYDEESGAIDSMASLSNMMLNSFTNPLDYVRNIANGTYSYDPSIRPVLDTSLISRGAYGINSMFDHQNVTLNGLSGSIAADIGQLDGSNAEIIAELRALRGDMTAMGEQIAGMQVVMDSGRLVGAIAPDIDRALGSRATANLRGKGN